MVECQEEDSKHDHWLEQLKVDRLPVFALYKDNVLLKSSCSSYVELIGASVYQLSLLLSMVENQQIQRLCPNSHPLEKLQPKADFEWICCECFRERQGSKEPIYRCADCIYHVCGECWFSDPTALETYEDVHGRSYLSTSFRPNRHLITHREVTYRCSSDHAMQFTRRRPTVSSKVRCYSCSQEHFFIGEEGAYFCPKCKESLCHRCCGRLEYMCERTQEYASHPFCETADNLPPCPSCHRWWKLTYSKQSNGSNYCMRCLAKEEANRLRLVCFYCQQFVCHRCLNESQAQEQQLEGGLCRCARDSVLECLQQGDNHAKREHAFQCAHQCGHRYYMKTPHYRCKGCASRYCKECTKLLEDSNRKSLSIVVVRQIKQSKGASLLRSYRLEESFSNQSTLGQVRDTLRQRLKLPSDPAEGLFVTLDEASSSSSQHSCSFVSKDLDMRSTVGRFQTHSVLLHYFESMEVLDVYVRNLGFRKRISELSNRKTSNYLSDQSDDNPEHFPKAF